MKNEVQERYKFQVLAKKADKRFFILALLSCRLFLFQQ
jgi:hypothetical protein